MPRLPTYQDVNQTGLQNTQRVLPGPTPVGNVPSVQDRRGEAIANFGGALFEVSNRIRDAQIENEVRKADIKTQVALEKFKQNLSTLEDENEYEKQWTEGAQKILNDAGNGLSSPMGQRLWKSRSEEYFGKGLLDVRDMARRKGVDKTKAQALELGFMASSLEDDPTATDEIRTGARNSAIAAMDNLAKRGFVSHEEAMRYRVGLESAALKKAQERTQLAQAQTFEDGIWTESGGDYGKASEMARAIKDPEMRDLVQSRIDDRNNTEKRALADQEEAAGQEIYTAMITGKPLSSIPKETWAKMRPQTIASMQVTYRNYQEAMTNGTLKIIKEKSDAVRSVIEHMADMPETSRQFVEPGYIEQYQNVLTPEDFAKLMAKRGQIMKGGGPTPDVLSVFNDAKALAEPMLGAFGFDTSPTKSASNEGKLGKAALFNGALLDATKAFVDKNNRKPNAKEMELLVQSAILRADKSVFAGTKIADRYDVSKTGKNIEASTARVIRYEDIPAADRNAVLLHLQKKNPGKVITNFDVRNEYSRRLTGAN